jgi:poly-D-alanine transfer protein DltD
MKILFIVRPSLFTVKGGDTVQVVETAAALRALDIQVDIMTADEIINYAAYDLLHFFNIIRPADMLKHIKKADKRYVVSSIFIDYAAYDQQYRGGMTGLLFKILSSDAIEYCKNLYRYFTKKSHW